jgi:hypothetical protein
VHSDGSISRTTAHIAFPHSIGYAQGLGHKAHTIVCAQWLDYNDTKLCVRFAPITSAFLYGYVCTAKGNPGK